jgi:hypothetical protein
MEKELKILTELKTLFQSSFKEMPEIEIVKGNHYYMTAGWAFILTFNDRGKLLLLFDDTINPLLSAKLTQLLSTNNIQFQIRNNYYYSPYDKLIYIGNQIITKQMEDREKKILQSNPIKTRQ